jgi:resuscitation-promoting factor RpfE
VSASTRISLFCLSLCLFLATATPVAWGHGGEDHGGADAELAAIVESDPGITADKVDGHLIEEIHEHHGHDAWNKGRGDWGHSWSTFRVEARRLRTYLLSQREQIRRFALVWHWSAVAECEASGNWAIDTGNGYYGGLQFTLGTWKAYGGSGWPQQQPAWFQAQIADHVRTSSGLHHWPVCGRLYR